MLALTSTLSLGATVQNHGRQLSQWNILRYSPTTQVTDHANIDLDQKAMEAQFGSEFPMDNSYTIYMNGAHSKPTGTCTITPALAADVASKEPITITTNHGATVTGKAKSSASAGDTSVSIMYPVGEMNPQPDDTQCYVNGLGAAASTLGCIDTAVDITIGGATYTCTSVSNAGGRTLKGFSTAAKSKMYDPTMSSKDCPATSNAKPYRFGCPYTSFTPFFDYYCADSTNDCYAAGDYAHNMINSAFTGAKTGLKNFNMDFTTAPGTNVDIRKQIIKKGTAYMSAWMYAIREFEDAIDDCVLGSFDNADSYGPVHAWDEGVAFYVGSLIPPTYLYEPLSQSISGQGKLAYTLGNKRCANFKTCGPNGDSTVGEAYINTKLWSLFREGQEDILIGNCGAVVPVKDEIVKKMSVPLVQGSLRYAYKCDKAATCTAAAAGEAAIFAAAILPYVNKCDATAAAKIATHLALDSHTCNGDSCTTTITSFNEVKAAFESTYECMGITCAEVGGLYSDGAYLNNAGRDASPCMDKYPPPPPPPPSPLSPAEVVEAIPGWGIALICVLGGLFVVVCLGFGYLIAMEKSGRPVFLSLNKGQA